MGSDNSKIGVCGEARNAVSECRSVKGCANRRKVLGNTKVISFYDDLREYYGLEFDENDIEYLECEEGDPSGILKRGKSHDVYQRKETYRYENTMSELNRSETFNIVFEGLKGTRGGELEKGVDICDEKLRSFLNDKVQVRVSRDKSELKLADETVSEKETIAEKRLIDREDLIDTTMRYICDSEKDSSLPLFPSSIYAGNITSNSWYTLKHIFEEEFVFEVPEGVEAVPLMGYSFSIDGSDTRNSPSLHGISFLECLRLSLGERKVVRFKVTKPQIWFRKINSERGRLIPNDAALSSRSNSGTHNCYSDGLINHNDDERDRYYCSDIIYCSVLSGSVSVVGGENKSELWWSFDTENNEKGKKKRKNRMFSNISRSAIHLPLSDSLSVGVSKIEQWLLDETTRNPYDWIPYIIPRKIINVATPVSVYDFENILLDATILWRCRYLIKSLGRYNTCLLAVAGNKFIKEEVVNSNTTNKNDNSLFNTKVYANQIITKFLDSHINYYTICFSELVDQLESWRVSHGITSEYCMEMISLFCLNGLITSECLLNYMNNRKRYLMNNREDETICDGTLMYYVSRVLLLRGISIKYLLRYQSNEFSIQHLRTKLQNANNTGSEIISLEKSISNILIEFETGKLLERSCQTFITGLHLIDLLSQNSGDTDSCDEKDCHIQLITSEMVMFAVLFFAEIKRDITFSKLIGEEYIDVNDNNHKNDDNRLKWNEIYGLDYLFKLEDFGLIEPNLDSTITLNTQRDYNINEENASNNLRFLKQRLLRVFESIKIKVHMVRIKLNTRFINFLLQKAVDDAREELQALRGSNNNTTYMGLGLSHIRKSGTRSKVFSTCCNSDNANSTQMNIGVHETSNYDLFNGISNKITNSTTCIQNNHEFANVENEETSFGDEMKPQSSSLFRALTSMAKKLVDTSDIKLGIFSSFQFQCCNTDKTDFRNLLDLADASAGSFEPPSWSILDPDCDKNVISNLAHTHTPNYVFSQISSDKSEELILDWIKLRSWNFTESDLRWIDGCRYLGEGEYEAVVLQLSPSMKIEDVARRILEEVDHSEVRRSLKSIAFGESCPLILVRNYIVPYGEILLPNPEVSYLIGAVKSCKFN